MQTKKISLTSEKAIEKTIKEQDSSGWKPVEEIHHLGKPKRFTLILERV